MKAGILHHRQPRAAFTLIEMLVAIGVLGALTSVAVTALVNLNRQQAGMADGLGLSLSFQRLARDFREDVHAAESASIAGDNGQRLQIVSADSHVVWYVDGVKIRRVSRIGELPDDVSQLPGESYPIPGPTALFAMSPPDGDRNGSLAVLHIPPTNDVPSAAAHYGLRISAAVGLDRRFETGAVQEVAP